MFNTDFPDSACCIFIYNLNLISKLKSQKPYCCCQLWQQYMADRYMHGACLPWQHCVMTLATARDLQTLHENFQGFFFYFKVKSASFEQVSAAKEFPNKPFPSSQPLNVVPADTLSSQSENYTADVKLSEICSERFSRAIGYKCH